MSNYAIDVNIGVRSVRNILTERTVPALEKERKWLVEAWEKFDNLPDEHQLSVKAMRTLIGRNDNYAQSLNSAVRAGLDDNDIETEVLSF